MMAKRYFRCNGKIPMFLQMYADGGEPAGDGAGGEGPDPAGDALGGDGEGGGDGSGGGSSSLDDFLKEGKHKEEFDRRVQSAVDEAVKKAQEKWQLMTDDRVSEAEKLAKMTKEEKDTYLKQKKEKELADRESAVTRRELTAEAKNTLAEKGLPVGLADVLNYTDADSCSKSITAVEKAFQEAVETAVQERLKGGEPQKKAPGGQDDLEKQIEALMRGEV